ncbi:hypothetical protein BV25DRAFT_1164479 [Artomyces pyxidatus]|uniref:Uncharacterized protein n=1 Tax=Artomyces pyxidatus TaxID=48021 RepID=A0ACB8SRH7_9AGAM|nr:hypothetical protein BV25DRAFT_1164479 [Artomyces pyxidatus]
MGVAPPQATANILKDLHSVAHLSSPSTTVMMKKQRIRAPSLSRTTLPLSVSLPYELWSFITAYALADHICNILGDGSYCYDAITVLLHLNRMSRECTLEHLYSLWGDTFVNTKSKKLSNFKPSVALIRELSIALRISSSSFHTHKLQANRAIRRPICAIVRISKLYWERSVQEAKFIHFPTMYMPRINEAIEQFPKAIELIAVERSRARGSGRDVLFGGIMEGFKKQQFRCLKGTGPHMFK